MTLLMQGEVPLRSSRIPFENLKGGMARLILENDESFVVYRDDHAELRVQQMPVPFLGEVLGKLTAGHGAHRPLSGVELSRVVYRIRRSIKLGDTVWMKAYCGGEFFCVFHYPLPVVDATMQPASQPRVPTQR